MIAILDLLAEASFSMMRFSGFGSIASFFFIFVSFEFLAEANFFLRLFSGFGLIASFF
jgi:hypothetical protein